MTMKQIISQLDLEELKEGDRVYHEGLSQGGIIVEIEPTTQPSTLDEPVTHVDAVLVLFDDGVARVVRPWGLMWEPKLLPAPSPTSALEEDEEGREWWFEKLKKLPKEWNGQKFRDYVGSAPPGTFAYTLNEASQGSISEKDIPRTWSQLTDKQREQVEKKIVAFLEDTIIDLKLLEPVFRVSYEGEYISATDVSRPKQPDVCSVNCSAILEPCDVDFNLLRNYLSKEMKVLDDVDIQNFLSSREDWSSLITKISFIDYYHQREPEMTIPYEINLDIEVPIDRIVDGKIYWKEAKTSNWSLKK